MTRITLVLFALVVFAAVAMGSMDDHNDGHKNLRRHDDCKQQPKCRKNEQLNKCARPADCDPTCKHPEGNQGKHCKTKKCEVRCVCKDGLVRNKKGQCVEPCDC